MKRKYFLLQILILLIAGSLPAQEKITAPEKLPAINAVYVTKALYDNRPKENSEKKDKAAFADYISYYLKSSAIGEINTYPYLKQLYGDYNLKLSDSEAYEMVDKSKLEYAGAEFASLQDLARTISSSEKLKKNLKFSIDSIDRLGFIDSFKVQRDSLVELTMPLDETIAQTKTTFKNELVQMIMDKIGGLSSIIKPAYYQAYQGHMNDLAKFREGTNFTPNTQYNFSTDYMITQSAAGGFSMPNQSEMIDAMAIFLAKRVEQESILWFFDELKKKAKLNQELNIMFPACMSLLKANEDYDMPKMGKAWRYAIAQDFAAMPEHFFNSGILDGLLLKKSSLTQLRSYVGYAGKIASLIQKKYTIDETINNLYIGLGKDLPVSIKADHFITVLYAVKQEFFVVSNKTKYWLSPAALIDMPDSMFMTMLSLTDMKYKGVFSKVLGTGKEFDLESDEIYKVKKVIAHILQDLQQIDNITRQAKTAAGDKDNIDFTSLNYTTWRFTDDLISVFDELLTITPSCKTLKSRQVYNLQTYLETLRAVLDVYAHIDKKDYYGAAQKTYNIYYALMECYPYNDTTAGYKILIDMMARCEKGVKNNKGLPDDAAAKRLLDSIRQQVVITRKIGFENLNAGVANSSPYPSLAMRRAHQKNTPLDEAKIKKLLDFDKSRYFVLKIASFLNDVSSANNSKDLAKVVSAYALPPTSYKRKQGTWNSVFLNAFVGPYVGWETLASAKSGGANASYKNGFVYGLTAPIGVSFSKTFGKSQATDDPEADTKIIKSGRNAGKFHNLSKSTLSIFVSMIDLGAVVSYRFTNSDSTLPQSFKWEQFVSPGLHLQYSIHGTPLVLSTGMVYTPLIRKVENQGGQYNALRAYFGVLFDIPVLAVHSKEKYKGY